MLKIKYAFEYLNKIENPTLKLVEGWTNKKEYIDNTFEVFLSNSNNPFEEQQLEPLKDWFYDISNLFKSKSNIIYPQKTSFKTEAIHYKKKIILKECLNLLGIIKKYHLAYRLRTKDKDRILENTIFPISSDKQAMRYKLNKFNKEYTNYRKDRKYRARFILLRKVLSLLLSDNYKKRTQYYLFSISLNFYCFNWDKIFEGVDQEIRDILFESLNYFMYKKLSEDKIKHSLMILVYTFLTKRLHLKEKDSLDLTNRLASDILYDLDCKNDYEKSELSKDIYIYDVFDYLPIFLHQDKRYKPPYTPEEEKKVIQTMKKTSYLLNESYKTVNEKFFIDAFKNSHVNYIKQELKFIYEDSPE